MILYINTTQLDKIIIALREGQKVVAQRQLTARHSQAEKLLPALDRLLKSQQVSLKVVKKIVVANQGGSFTSLRIGVITANALAYALQIPIESAEGTSLATKKFATYSVIEPLYDRPPNIGQAKKPLL